MGLYRRKGSRFWWMSSTLNRESVFDSTKTTSKEIANKIWKKREGEIRLGLSSLNSGPCAKLTVIPSLFSLLLRNQRQGGMERPKGSADLRSCGWQFPMLLGTILELSSPILWQPCHRSIFMVTAFVNLFVRRASLSSVLF